MIIMSTDRINEYDAQLSQLNARLKPLGDRLPENRPSNYTSALDELGVQAEATRLMAVVTELYTSNPETRDRIRDMFSRYRYIRWALWPTPQPTNEELFREYLLAISMRDVGDDPRDTPIMLAHVCEVATAAGVDVGSVLESVAAISSDHNPRGWKSIREMMLEAKHRFSSKRV
jgi:hypothetical protein